MPKRIPTYRPPWVPTFKPKRTWTPDQRERKRFYDSARWRRFRRMILAERPLCEECCRYRLVIPGVHLHHVRSIENAPDLALEPDNVLVVCRTCHNRLEPRAGSAGSVPEGG